MMQYRVKPTSWIIGCHILITIDFFFRNIICAVAYRSFANNAVIYSTAVLRSCVYISQLLVQHQIFKNTSMKILNSHQKDEENEAVGCAHAKDLFKI